MSTETVSVPYYVQGQFEGKPYDPALLERVRGEIAQVFAPRFKVTLDEVPQSGPVTFSIVDTQGKVRGLVLAEPTTSTVKPAGKTTGPVTAKAPAARATSQRS